ncbi:hypothetical protein F8M41_012451 [Gigaspora margarita]|uniref:Uncharacterized protein n=1 Tax=Gigaspora margarita TaxID=4874 RepID=A0A8H3WZK5_GIGMA|nr:hypothetical protein F8M41_012451 [Gigaspora margarita]
MAFSSAAKFSINFIAKRWLYEEYQDNDLGAQPLVNLSTVFLSEPSEALSVPTTILRTNDTTNLFLTTNSVPTMVHLSISAKKAMKKKKAYAKTIGIARKAINIAIEKDDQCVLKFLEEYIIRNEHSLIENTASASSLGQQSNLIEECSESNIVIEKSPVIVSNPIKKVRRARGPGTNMCGECGGKGHNRRWHAKHKDKDCDLSIHCELCGGCSHNKEAHDSIEVNKESECESMSSSESEAEIYSDE